MASKPQNWQSKFDDKGLDISYALNVSNNLV